MQARKQALEADVVVVNHHLFFADVVLRDEGVGELLPACNTVIFDEAHQLPETATLFFGESVSTAQLVELARDTVHRSRGRGEGHARAARRGARRSRKPRATCGSRSRKTSGRAADARRSSATARSTTRWTSVARSASTRSAPSSSRTAERSEGLQRCRERALELAERVRALARAAWTASA